MREILNFPQIDYQKLELVKKLIDSIAEKSNGDYEAELSQLSSITGKSHDAIEFAEYWGWTDLDTLAAIALTPEPPCVRDLTQDEIKEVVTVVKECFIIGEDNKAEYYLELLHKSLALPNAMDLIMSEDNAAKVAEKLLKAAEKSVILL